MQDKYRMLDDSGIYRKYKSIGHLERGIRIGAERDDYTYVELVKREVILKAKSRAILSYNLTTSHPADQYLRYHWPLIKWEFVDGDTLWLPKIYADFGWTLPKSFTSKEQHETQRT